MVASEIVLVRTFASRMDADMAKTVLEGSGVECFIQSDDCGGMGIYFDQIHGVHIFVRKEDAKRADEVLKHYESSRKKT
jgi:hypothetical protein